ncbi:MAG: segregation and condensation protein A [Halanaerobiaceae bacterium]
MDYKIKLDSFEGPLDLLYQMVKKNEIELNEISLARVTEQYLEYTGYFQSFDLEVASEFMLIAGELIQLKTSILLPQKEDAGEEEEKMDLVTRLEEYEFYKNIAQKLKEYRKEASRIYYRPEEMTYLTEEEYKLELKISPDHLREIYNQVLTASREKKEEVQEKAINDKINYLQTQKYKVEDKVNHVREELTAARDNQVLFRELITRKNDFLEVVVTLLGILELVHLKEVKVKQTQLFSEITIILVNRE